MAEYVIQGKTLTLVGDPAACTYTVKRGQAEWKMTQRPYVEFMDGEKIDFPAPAAEGAIRTGTRQGIRAEYKGFGAHDIAIVTKAEIEMTSDDVFFSLVVTGDKKCEIKQVSFPAPIDFGEKYGDKADQQENNLPYSYTVLTHRQGKLLPLGVHTEQTDCEVYTTGAYMPFFGQVRGNVGYIAIYDTPYDAKYDICYDDGEKLAPAWIESLGYMAYPRRIIYRFLDKCDHNVIAKAYRRYAETRGRVVTLKEKAERNPLVKELMGCPIIHAGLAVHISPDSDYYHKDEPEKNDRFTSFAVCTAQIKALKEKGLQKAYTHFDGWGNHGYDNLHPDALPPHEAAGGWEGMRELGETVNGCGYIFGIHDQYRDYYYEGENFSLDNAAQLPDGSYPFCSRWYGGKHSFLCSDLAREYVRRNYDDFANHGVPVRASYLDVFSMVMMDECINPEHPATREQCAANRRECLDILTDRGIIPSSEEMLDCILPSQVLAHFVPFATDGYGEGKTITGLAIPLVNMVYHDCLVTPWIGRKGNHISTCIPVNDTAYTHAWLNAGPQYLNIEAEEDEIAEAVKTCEHAERLAYQQMVKHEFVTADMRTQRTTYEDGTTVEVNFDTEEIVVKYPD